LHQKCGCQRVCDSISPQGLSCIGSIEHHDFTSLKRYEKTKTKRKLEGERREKKGVSISIRILKGS